MAVKFNNIWVVSKIKWLTIIFKLDRGEEKDDARDNLQYLKLWKIRKIGWNSSSELVVWQNTAYIPRGQKNNYMKSMLSHSEDFPRPINIWGKYPHSKSKYLDAKPIDDKLFEQWRFLHGCDISRKLIGRNCFIQLIVTEVTGIYKNNSHQKQLEAVLDCPLNTYIWIFTFVRCSILLLIHNFINQCIN